MKHASRIGVFLGVFLLVMVLANPGFAQETTGTIQGTVKDATGAVVPKAAVEISGPALITSRKMDTDEAGFYRFTLLPSGVYAVTVTATGFRQAKRTTIKLEVGRALPIDFSLEVGAVAATVEVQATPEIVDTTSSKAAINLTADVIENLPKGRSFTSMIALAPGARQEPLQAGFQIDGSSDGENVYAFEGMDTTHIRTGGVGVNIPLDFVQEVNIKSSGFDAEYGGALGGVVNIVSKRGSNNWHGSGLLYYTSGALQASDRPTLRQDPAFSVSTSTRTSEPAQYFQPKEDKWRTIEPGMEIGGPIMRDRLWLYVSYIPSLSRTSRTILTQPPAPAPAALRTYVQTNNTLYGLGRLDWQASRTVRASASWQYSFNRFEGALPGADSVFGPTVQLNTSRTGDPGRFRPDNGQVRPNSTFTFTGEWTPTPRLVVQARFGYWHTNLGDRGVPVGIRDLYTSTASATTLVMGTAAVPPTPAIPSSVFGSSGFSNMDVNSQRIFDVFNRHGLDLNGSYFLRGWGTHTFKGGYSFNRLFNDVDLRINTALVRIAWGTQYSPVLATGQAACTAIAATNAAAYGVGPPTTSFPGGAPWGCRGLYGWYIVRDGVTDFGKVSSFNHSIYIQDSWNVGHGVTLNLGVRFDKERLPSYTSGTGIVSTPIAFGFGDKFAPRLGGAWDVFRNGKLKVYASWGYFYDIMKYELPRGSFGGDYWHDCAFTLETTNLSTIAPIASASNHTCPSGGGNPGRFIENIDWRTVANSSTNSRIVPDLKPMKQHEFVAGGEYSLRHNVGLDVRYSRKRLDHTIEDVGVFDANVGEDYYIGNPGEGILTRPLAIPGTPPLCAACPPGPKPTRNYDGLEVRVQKRWSNNWYGSASYTYSRLWGNYSGLTSTDENGRHSPNVNRYFDLPHMAFDSHGKPAFGLLPTDRPHTLKMYGAYRLKWWGMETTFGGNQLIYSGTPLTTELSIISTQTSSHPIEGRGTFVNITRAANGDWVLGAIERGKRTPVYTNTDALVVHEFKLSKTNENLRASVELNVINLFNESNVLGVRNLPIHPTSSIISFGADPATGSPNWAYFFAGYNYIAVANNPSLIPTGTSTLGRTLDSTYGMPNRFQGPRNLRFKLQIKF